MFLYQKKAFKYEKEMKFFLKQYRNAEYLQFMKDVLQIINQEDIEQLLISTEVNDLTTQVAEINTIFKQSLASDLTKDIASLNKRRNYAYKGMRAMLASYKYHYDTTLSTAAASLFDVFSFYDQGKSKTSYQKLTVLLDSLIDDLETKTELQEFVTLFGITDWVNELKNANTDFKNLYIERVSERVENPIRNIRDLRTECNELYNKLFIKIGAYGVTSETVAPYLLMVENIEGLIKKYDLLITSYNASDEASTDDSLDDTATTEVA